MVINLSTRVEEELRRLADQRGRGLDVIVEEAIRQYLDLSAITDVTTEEVATTQALLMSELGALPTWPAGQEPA